jgi:ATP-dependent DNA helicase RecQ
MILDYFGDESEAQNCDCDICRRQRGGASTNISPPIPIPDEVTLIVRKLLSAIARVSMRGQFGVGMIADVLSGSESEKIQRWGFENLSVFGLMRAYPNKRIIAMLHRLMEGGLARQRDPEGMKFRPVVELTTAGVEVMKGKQPVPATLADLIGRAPEPAPRSSRRETIGMSDEALD